VKGNDGARFKEGDQGLRHCRVQGGGGADTGRKDSKRRYWFTRRRGYKVLRRYRSHGLQGVQGVAGSGR
jgi:hypothetical protein